MGNEVRGRRDSDEPLAGLPQAHRVLLRSPQLEVALVEVRFAGGKGGVSAEDALAMRDVMAEGGTKLPQMNPAQQQEVTVQVNADGSVSPDVDLRSSGWQLNSTEGDRVVTILPGMAAIQATAYERWRVTLEEPLGDLLRAIREVLGPEIVQRVGLRYINRLVHPSAAHASDWSEAISPAFLGVIADPTIGSRVSGTQQQVQLTLGDSQGALIRHGAFVDRAEGGRFSYLVDIDVFDQGSARFEPDEILGSARSLNRTALSLFQQIVMTNHLSRMEPYAEVTSEGSVVPLREDVERGTDETGERSD